MNILMNNQVKAQVNPSFTPVNAGRLQRKCRSDECEESRKKRLSLQRSLANRTEPAGVSPIVHEVLNSQGQPLDTSTRAVMEPRFGHDFSRVRVHANSKATESANAVSALAYTVGQNVVFGEGQYAPGTRAGQKLLAHELAHVVQQSDNGIGSGIKLGDVDSVYEREAESVSARLGDLPVEDSATGKKPRLTDTNSCLLYTSD